MSYILDALKKAERERGIRQIPTLMTEHTPRAAHRNRSWIVVSILVIGAAAIGWYFLYRRQPVALQPTTSVEHTPVSNESAATQGAAINSGESRDPLPLQSPPIQKDEHRSNTPTGTDTLPPPRVVAMAGTRSRANPVEIVRRSQINEEENPGRMDEEDVDEDSPQDVIRNGPQPKSVLVESVPAQTRPASLKEAAGRMTLSLLMYSENKSERMIFIDSRKYVEGDYVDGIYLLESITMDGAILSYQGERVLLQPKSK
jgi:general secretion pathway protein B